MIEYLLHVIGWWLLSIVKFLFVPFAMILKPDVGEDWNWLETVIISATGASIGIWIFYKFGDFIFQWISKHFKTSRKTFTKRNRSFVRIKQKWGITGLMIICALISVPVSAMLAAKLFRHDNTAMARLVLAFWIWSVALSSIALGMKKIGLSF
jgi:hypothetical protein